MWTELFATAKAYAGNGRAVALLAVAGIYLFVKEKEKTKRAALVYLSVASLVLYFIPVIPALINRFGDDEVAYRLLWLLPMTAVIGYAMVLFLGNIKKTWLRVPAFLICLALLVLTGDYVYDNPYFSVAENRFHVPNTVIQVCDAIIVEGREVKAVMPGEMLPYVRQYTANVVMPYGREAAVERWELGTELYYLMEAETLDAEAITVLAAQEQCAFIVVHGGKPRTGSMEQNDYRFYRSVAGYEIYLWDLATVAVGENGELISAF